MCDFQETNQEVGSGRSGAPLSFILRPSSISRSAFTLVELLVVIVIIGILMGLITAAAGMARSAARRAAIGVEIANLDVALKKYRDQFGEYPPDCTDLTSTLTPSAQVGAVFMRHLSRAFPRFVVPGATPNAQFATLNTQFYNVSGFYLSNLDASTALVFFLAGWPANGGYATNFSNQQLVYFSSDPTDPLDIYACGYTSSGANAKSGNGLNIPTSRLTPLFQFDGTRLQQSTIYSNSTTATNVGWWQFFPNTGSTNGNMGNCPYIYFRATANGYDPYTGKSPVWGYNVNNSNTTGYVYQRWPSNGVLGVANSFNADIVIPYYQFSMAQQLYQWYMNKDYQLISAGLDNHFGYRYSVPLENSIWSLSKGSNNGSNEILFGYDNQTNFSTPTIENTK
jgi:prepilin-type N-terminal cleavage/methylation domain-containing protein